MSDSSSNPSPGPAGIISAESRAWIERLIAFDTTSRNSNLELIATIRDELKTLGVEATLTHNAERTKANLYATLGPSDRPGIALSGHTDVVPVDGQDWSSDPFAVVEKDRRLYGRGSCDMKSFVAIALAFAPRMLERGLETPIHLCFSFDEEVGCLGVPHLLADLARQPVRPALCIIGEPTSMKVITAHKGKVDKICHLRGKEAHSSLAPKGVNAINYAARLIAYIESVAQRKAAEGPFDPDFDITHTTVHTGLIEGGTQLNIVPGHCRFEYEIRNLPSEDPWPLVAEIEAYARDELEPAMKAIDPESGIAWEEVGAYPGLNTRADEEVVALGKALTGSNDTGKVAFGTEGGLFQQAGIPAIVCGPGSIEQAHKPDEFCSLEQLALCERFMERLMERVCQTSRLTQAQNAN